MSGLAGLPTTLSPEVILTLKKPTWIGLREGWIVETRHSL